MRGLTALVATASLGVIAPRPSMAAVIDRGSAANANALSSFARQRLAHFGALGMSVVGRYPANSPVEIVVLPRLDHAAELPALIQAQSTPGNPLYRRYLTGPQFKNYFGPSESTVRSAISVLTANGFHIERASSSHDLIVASATSKMAEQLFGVPIYTVRRADGSLRHANLEDYDVPSVLSRYVNSITGLDSALEAHSAAVPAATPDTTFNGASPATLEAANDMPILHGYKGSINQTLTVLIDGRPNPSDVSVFLSGYGITDAYPLHQVNTGNGQVGTDKLEATLDVETISSVAPNAYLSLYTTPDLTENSVLEGVNSFVNNNASGNSATLSMSFGECDNDNHSYDSSLYQETNTGTSKGQTFVAATGDYGVDKCGQDKGGPTDVPASDILVLGVGGTSPDTEYSKVWQGGPQGQYGWVGSGGGSSSYYGTPPYQTGLGICGTRCLPDIALPADPSGGLIYYCSSGCTYNGQNYNGYYAIGGTSLASPLAASALAEIAEIQGKAIGFTQNAIYATYGAGYGSGELVDITAGNNGAQAKPGWDFVSGVGTPDWYKLSSI